MAGNLASSLEVDLENITLPEFFRSRKLSKIQARVFMAPCRYDAIIGRDVLNELGLKLDFKDNKMTWDDCHVPMKAFEDMNTKNPYGLKEPSVAERVGVRS